MGRKTKSNKRTKNHKKSQRGGLSLNPLNWFKGDNNEVGGAMLQPESVVQPQQESGIFSGITGFFGKASEKGQGLLQGAEGFIGEQTNKLSSTVTEGISNIREKGADILNPKTNEANLQAQAQDANLQAQDANLQAQDTNLQAQDTNLQAQEGMPASVGGRRRKMKGVMKGVMKGGKADLSYYAAPVHGLKVAEPKYWISGGTKRKSKKSKKSRKARRGRKSRKCRKM